MDFETGINTFGSMTFDNTFITHVIDNRNNYHGDIMYVINSCDTNDNNKENPDNTIN